MATYIALVPYCAEMLTGAPLYQGGTSSEILEMVRTTTPKSIRVVNPRAHPGLAKIAEWAMERELCDRYASMKYMIADLDRVAQNMPPVGPHTHARPMVSWRAAITALGLVVLLALFLVTLKVLISSSPRKLNVTNLENDGEGSLRQAILKANDDSGPQEITFASGVTGTIQLGEALPDLVSEVTIRGPGAEQVAHSTR